MRSRTVHSGRWPSCHGGAAAASASPRRANPEESRRIRARGEHAQGRWGRPHQAGNVLVDCRLAVSGGVIDLPPDLELIELDPALLVLEVVPGRPADAPALEFENLRDMSSAASCCKNEPIRDDSPWFYADAGHPEPHIPETIKTKNLPGPYQILLYTACT